MNGQQFLQRGSIVIVALIVLLAMTLIAVSMVNSAILQEQMTGNSRQKVLSRYAAEVALDEAEKRIATENFSSKDNMTSLFDRTTKGYYSAASLSLSPGIVKTAAPVDFDITDVSQWDERANAVAVNGVINTTITSRAPHYIVEYLGQQQAGSVTEKSLNNDEATIQSEISYFFRVIAIGWGKDPQIYTILQSIYRVKSAVITDDASEEISRISWSIIH